jgi:hypothetical protein
MGALLCFPSLLLVIPALIDVTHLHACCHAGTIVLIVLAIIVVCVVFCFIDRRNLKKKRQENSERARTEAAAALATLSRKPEYQPSGASYTVSPQSDYGTGINGDTSAPAASSDTQPQVSPYALYHPGTLAASPPESGSPAPPPAFPYGNAVNSCSAAQQNHPTV